MADYQLLQSPTNPHFFQPLLPGFHSHLTIPLKFFSQHIEGRNEKHKVKLESDACKKIWKVKIQGHKLTVGWKEFAYAHNLRIGDIIIFRHKGDLVFHVTSFGPSCCEIQYEQSCNIRNLSKKQHVETEPESKEDNMGNLLRKKRNLATQAKSFSSDESCFVASITDSNLREDKLFLPRKFQWPNGLKNSRNKIVIVNETLRTWTLNLKFRESSGTFYMTTGWRRFCRENEFQTGDSIAFKLERNNTKTPLFRVSTTLDSKKVPTKYGNKGKKQRKASESSHKHRASSSSSLSENRFVTLTVRPATFKYQRLYLPSRFTRVNKMENAEGKKITILDKYGVKWQVNLVMEKENAMMRLSLGLNRFLKANDLKAYDSFVLELVWEETTSLPMLKFCFKIKT